MRSKADFKARRETLGLSQQDVADELGVAVRTVKRWEAPGWPEPPADAWSLIEECEERRRWSIDVAERAVLDSHAAVSGEVMITYYRTQKEYDELGRDERPFGMANANARAVAESLQRMGYRVRFVYPEERSEHILSFNHRD